MRKLNSVFDYKDYRKFLKDHYETNKKADKNYSYRKMAIGFGYEPSNFFHLVILGKRNLSIDGIKRIQSKIKWSAREKNYFFYLVLFNQSKAKTEQEKFRTEMQKIQEKTRHLISSEQYEYFRCWYIPILRELLSLKNFIPNLNGIGQKLKIPLSKTAMRYAIHVLEKLKMIERVKTRWQQIKEHLTTENEVKSEVLCNYHKEMLQLSRVALKLPSKERKYSAMTMTLSSKQFEWLKSKLDEFDDEIQQNLQESEDNPTLLAQFNVQLFKLTND